MPVTRCRSCGADNDLRLDLCFSCGSSLSEIGAGGVLAGRFELLVEVGRGLTGWVFRAHDRVLDEAVAVKVLLPEFIAAERTAQRFRSEVRLARRVAHPNLCRIFEYGEEGDVHYLAMEYIDGIDVHRALRSRPAGLPAREAMAVSLGVAEGLQAIHEAGIVHRNLKSQNVMIDARGLPRLTDFGIAKEVRRTSRKSITGPGMAVGTPEYMSPEHCRGYRLDARADVYSLGILCHELFTGRVPFRGGSLVDTLMLQVHGEPDWPEAVRRGLPAPLVEPLAKALRKEPSERFGSADAFAEALRRAAAGAGTEEASRVTSISARERRRDRRLDIPVSCRIRTVAGSRRSSAEEMTVAENISRGGVRVKTSLATVGVGDHVVFEETGGPFRVRTEVMASGTFSDGVRRLHLRFIDHAAPAHLVG